MRGTAPGFAHALHAFLESGGVTVRFLLCSSAKRLAARGFLAVSAECPEMGASAMTPPERARNGRRRPYQRSGFYTARRALVKYGEPARLWRAVGVGYEISGALQPRKQHSDHRKPDYRPRFSLTASAGPCYRPVVPFRGPAPR